MRRSREDTAADAREDRRGRGAVVPRPRNRRHQRRRRDVRSGPHGRRLLPSLRQQGGAGDRGHRRRLARDHRSPSDEVGTARGRGKAWSCCRCSTAIYPTVTGSTPARVAPWLRSAPRSGTEARRRRRRSRARYSGCSPPSRRRLDTNPGGDRESVLFAASAAVGAMVLARATHDESLAGELLSAVRKRLLAANEKAPVRRRPGTPD